MWPQKCRHPGNLGVGTASPLPSVDPHERERGTQWGFSPRGPCGSRGRETAPHQTFARYGKRPWGLAAMRVSRNCQVGRRRSMCFQVSTSLLRSRDRTRADVKCVNNHVLKFMECFKFSKRFCKYFILLRPVQLDVEIKKRRNLSTFFFGPK